MLLLLSLLLLSSSLLIHEAGHWAALRRYGVPVEDFALGLGPRLFRVGRLSVRAFPIGASVTPEAARYEALRPLQHFWVALAGPWFSALYGSVLAYLGAHTGGTAGEGLQMLGAFNWFLAGVNLVPLPPLDGFRVMLSLLAMRGVQLSSGVLVLCNRAGNGLVYALMGLLLGTGISRALGL